MATVLVVEDDQRIREAVTRTLADHGHVVRARPTALDGLRSLTEEPPDVVLLDLGLPDLEGGELLKMIRAVSTVPVIVATAREDEREMVRLLDAGADDYVVKPFTGGQIEARVRAVLRRTEGGGGRPAALSVGGLNLDRASRAATLDGTTLDLTPKEFDLLAFLAGRAGEVVGRDELLAEVWRQPQGGGDKTIDVHLSWLRRKLGESAADPRYLRTVRGVGVMLVDPGPDRVRRRVVLLVTSVAAMVALAFLVPLALLIREVARDRALTDADRAAQAVVPVLSVTDQPDDVRRALESADLTEGDLTVYLGSRVVGDPVPVDDDVRLARRSPTSFTAEADGGVAVLTSVEGPDGDVAVVRVLVPDDELSSGVTRSWVALGLVGLGLLLVAALVADRLGRGLVRPVRELAAAAERLGEGDLSVRVTPAGPAELAQVGRAFNDLVDRVRRLLAAERELVADLSHRLRTPLTALQLDAEAVGDPELARRLAGDVSALERAVDELIVEARSGAAAGGGGADLADVAAERFRFWSALAEEQGRPASLAGSGPLPVGLGTADLEAVVDALLGNVFAHTDEPVSFSLTVAAVDGTAELVVADAGPGFDPAAVARGRSASSTGLGLDIARRTAEAAGGTFAVDRAPAGGAQVTLRLPLAR